MWRPAVDRSGASCEPGSPAGGRRRGALHPVALCCTGTRMCCTEIGSKAACACNTHTCVCQHAVAGTVLPVHAAEVKAVPDPAACCHACNVPQKAPLAVIPYSCLEGSMEQNTVKYHALEAAERLG